MGSSHRSTRSEREVPHSSYAGGGAAQDDCSLSFPTKLMKPTPAAATLNKGDNLLISLDAKDNITAFDKGGNLCGYIVTAANQEKLVACLKKGKDYSAEVLSKLGTSCEVMVYGGK